MLPPIIILGSLGILFGFGLFVASRVFRVHIDPRVGRIQHALPGSNCGACGFAGCSGFAKAIVHGSADVAGCIPGGEDVSHLVADIMGVEAQTVEKRVAVLHCNGREVPDKYEYEGIRTCQAASLLFGGPKECPYGCIAFGDCAKACPFDALHMVNDFPEVDEEKCTSCGKCVAACPKGLFELVSLSGLVHIRCESTDKGKLVRKYCNVGCIGCKKCETVCKFDAVHIEDNLARIDYEKCTSCGMCVKECPTGTILNYRKARKELGLWPVKKAEEKQDEDI
jgi:RnfABCDGE-type electron transport complex B subunit